MRRNLYTLESRIRRLEKLVKEAKQVGTIYHVCTIDAYLKFIASNDTLQASGKYYNWVYGGDDYVSFTRDKYFVVGTKSVQQSKVLVQLVVDGDKLSENYRIGPYNDFAFGPDGEHVEETPSKDGKFQPTKYREKEEAVKGPIKHISKYIKEIRVDVFDMDNGALSKLRKSKLAENDKVKYFHFIKGYQDKEFTEYAKQNGIVDGMSLSDALPIMANYVKINSKLNDLLFSRDEGDVAKAIKLKANLNIKYPYGYILEEYCIDDEYLNIVEMLLKAGADPNLKMSIDRTPIMIAAEYDCPEIIKLLSDFGANVNENIPNTALILASRVGNKSAVQALIDAGADVNLSNAKGETPLSAAKNRQIAKLLIQSGATE